MLLFYPEIALNKGLSRGKISSGYALPHKRKEEGISSLFSLIIGLGRLSGGRATSARPPSS
jgi:hypothetical protein